MLFRRSQSRTVCDALLKEMFQNCDHLFLGVRRLLTSLVGVGASPCTVLLNAVFYFVPRFACENDGDGNDAAFGTPAFFYYYYYY